MRLRGLRVCVRLRGRWPLIGEEHASPERPSRKLSGLLADWLQGPRSRALRRAGIGRRERVLEVGCGHGFVTDELRRRARGEVVSIDIAPASHVSAAADARDLPFAGGSFDLVFFQNALMWIDQPHGAIHEAARALCAGGVLVALEPDYGGMLEHPDLGLRVVWLDALERAGADPLMGRKLPELAEEAGLEPWVEFAHIPREAEPEALDLLADLPLTARQRERVAGARELAGTSEDTWSPFLHVPWLMIVAKKCATREGDGEPLL